MVYELVKGAHFLLKGSLIWHVTLSDFTVDHPWLFLRSVLDELLALGLRARFQSGNVPLRGFKLIFEILGMLLVARRAVSGWNNI